MSLRDTLGSTIPSDLLSNPLLLSTGLKLAGTFLVLRPGRVPRPWLPTCPLTRYSRGPLQRGRVAAAHTASAQKFAYSGRHLDTRSKLRDA